MPYEQPACRAADDFEVIRENQRRIEAERALALSGRQPESAAGQSVAKIGTGDPAAFEVVCNQPTPEEYGVIAAGDDIAIARSAGRHQ